MGVSLGTAVIWKSLFVPVGVSALPLDLVQILVLYSGVKGRNHSISCRAHAQFCQQ